MIDPACFAVFPTIGNKKNHADQAILLRKIQSPIVDPRFLYVFPLDGVTRFFYLFGENLIFRKRLGVTTYFCFIFFKRKQNKKENLKCDSLIGKDSLWKTKVGSGG